MKISYDKKNLSYKVKVVFPYSLKYVEKLMAENIMNYWGHIPYVSTEGIYNIEWYKTKKNRSKAIISIDFTKSASDDYMLRKPLELLGEWLYEGTPKRKKDGSRKYPVLGIKPKSISTGEV